MPSYGIEKDLTRESILEQVSQQEIFEYFMEIPIDTKNTFCSPLRNDEHPTCNFNWYGGTLWFRDWAEPKPKDCFQLVKDLYRCDFFEALQIIKREIINGENTTKLTGGNNRTIEKQPKSKATINVKFARRWQPTVIEYLKQYEITSELCKKYNVFPLKKVWLNGRVMWNYSKRDPAIGYYFGKTEEGEQRWKIYFFNRSEKRFVCNTNRINGWIQIPEKGNNLIITKSLKDVMCLDKCGYPSIAMQNETTEPYKRIMDKLNSRFETVWSFYDFDYPGIKLANTLYHKYQTPYIFLTNGKYWTKDFGSKDISDYIKDQNLDTAQGFLYQRIPPF